MGIVLSKCREMRNRIIKFKPKKPISSIDDAIYDVNKILHEFKEEVPFAKLANSLYDGGKQDTVVAKRKYGENHAKLSTLMDLTKLIGLDEE